MAGVGDSPNIVPVEYFLLGLFREKEGVGSFVYEVQSSITKESAQQ